MFKAILKSFVANIFFFKFFYKYCIKYFLILTVSFTKKGAHNWTCGAKTENYSVLSSIKYFCSREIVLNSSCDQICPG